MIPQSRNQKMSKAKANQKGRRLRRTCKSKFFIKFRRKGCAIIKKSCKLFSKKKENLFSKLLWTLL